MRFAALWLMTTVSCAPAIYSFEAKPNVSCPGAAFTLSWNASKGGRVSSTPSSWSSSLSSTGSTSVVTPKVTTRYRLDVENVWGSASREVDVQVPAGTSISIGASVADPSATCADGRLSVTAKAPLDAWQANLVVAEVTTLAGDLHHYQVVHAGKSADLTPGSVSDALSGSRVAGDWSLVETLRSDEQCGTPTVPLNLGIRLTTACTLPQ